MSEAQSRNTILVVDDTEISLDVLNEALNADYNVLLAASGQEALQKAEDFTPDLILLDILMPAMDGYQVCRQLKKNKSTRDIPIIFVTVKGEVSDELHGFDLGAVDYITKPISPPIVQARVKTHLALNAARKRLETQNRELLQAARLREDVNRITRHDLKGPLNSIMLTAEIMSQAPGRGSKDLDDLKLIDRAAHRMLIILNDSLGVFKMELGCYELEPEKIDIRSITQKILDDLQALSSIKKLTTRVSLHGAPSPDSDRFFVQGEEALCYSIMDHLIRNAMEASPQGGEVNISFDSREQAVIKISNQGAVPEEIKDRFFAKYVTQGKKQGTGLGTYTAKIMAEVQRGEISFESSPQNGTTLKVCLPLPD